MASIDRLSDSLVAAGVVEMPKVALVKRLSDSLAAAAYCTGKLC